jgi:F-type H+-transporting ATPase subunit b
MKLFFGSLIVFLTIKLEVIAAEAGMPQLDPKYWASQAFWLVIIFSSLYLSIAKLFIPKIKNSLESRENKIKEDLDEAKSLKDEAEAKQNKYQITIDEAKKDVLKILFENKNKLDLDIQKKKKAFEKKIEEEIQKASKEILDFKNNSIKDIDKISEEIAAQIIEDISGVKLNESSVKAAILEVSKSKSKYL